MSDANREREIERISQAILSAAKSHFGHASQVDVHIDHESVRPSVSVNGQPLTHDEIGDLLGRVAARSAKPVIIQKILEAEREASENRRDDS
jgi:transcription termination/antitermination protein NusA